MTKLKETIKNPQQGDIFETVHSVVKRFFRERPEIWISFCIAYGAMFFAYMMFKVWPAGGRSVLCLDLNAQYVYYHIYMRDALFGSESILYSWSRNFSGEFIGIIGYYLFSPFNLLVWIFPVSHVTEGLLLMIVTKIGFIAVTMAVYLSVWRGFGKYTTIMFSVMYALCGYSIVQTMNPMWLDGVMILPLVVMGIEALLKDGKYKLLIFSLFYSFVTCFYIGYMIGIFAALYFIYYGLTSRRLNKKSNVVLLLKRSGLFSLSAIISVLMSAFILLPVYASLSLGKFEFSTPDYSFKTNFAVFDMTRKLFMNSYDTVRMEGLPFIFVGTLALVMIGAYFFCGRVRRLRRLGGALLMASLITSMVIRPVDMMWHGGQMPNWLPYRYSFMLGFLILAFGAEAFEHIRKIPRAAIWGTLIYFGTLLVYWWGADTFMSGLGNDGRDVFENRSTLIPAALMLVVFTVYVTLAKNKIHSKQKYNGFAMILVALVSVEMTYGTLYALNAQNIDITYSERESWESIVATREITDELNRTMRENGEFYRMEKNFMRAANDSMAVRMRGVTHSSSMLNANAIHAMNGFGYAARSHSGRYWGATPLTDDIFGFKYTLSAPTRHHSSVNSVDDITISTNDDALPIAYLVDLEVLEHRLVAGDVFNNQSRLLTMMLGDNVVDEGLETVNPYFERVTPHTRAPDNLSEEAIGQYTGWRRTAQGVNAHIEYSFIADADGDVYLYFPSAFERRTNLWLRRYDDDNHPFMEGFNTNIGPQPEFLGQMYETDHHHIQYIGWFREGERYMITVSLPAEGDVMFFREENFMRMNLSRLEADVARIHEMNANSTFRAVNNRHLRITTDHDEERLLFTSIPMEPGWRAYVNGERVDIEGIVNWTQHVTAEYVVDDEGNRVKDEHGNDIISKEAYDIEHSAFIAVIVPPGVNTIELRFFPNMMPVGIALTFMGLAGFFLLGAVLGFMRPKAEQVISPDVAESREESRQEKVKNKSAAEVLEDFGINSTTKAKQEQSRRAGSARSEDCLTTTKAKQEISPKDGATLTKTNVKPKRGEDEYEAFDPDYVDDDRD
jgi:uncharacterized membrane protein YfhO